MKKKSAIDKLRNISSELHHGRWFSIQFGNELTKIFIRQGWEHIFHHSFYKKPLLFDFGSNASQRHCVHVSLTENRHMSYGKCVFNSDDNTFRPGAWLLYLNESIEPILAQLQRRQLAQVRLNQIYENRREIAKVMPVDDYDNFSGWDK